MDQYRKQNSLTLKLNMSRQTLAEIFGIPRPSLSRELINMKNDKLIDVEKYNNHKRLRSLRRNFILILIKV